VGVEALRARRRGASQPLPQDRSSRSGHGAAGELLGRRDVSLDDEGRAQAEAIATAVPAAVEVVSSPLARAVETAEALGPDRTIDERWIELDYGDLDGMPLADVDAAVWRQWRSDADFAPAGGESLRRLGRRVAAACQDLRELARSTDVVVVSHVSPIKAAVAWALDVGVEVSWRTFVAPASISTVRFERFGPVLASFNETAHLHR
jgi:broad specificity phosphatase PhoE